MKDKKHIALLCFLTDLSLCAWSYFKLTNYDEYIKNVRPIISSPDFQLQIYQVLLQSLTFSMILFLVFHLVIYFLFWRGKTSAMKYLRFYTFTAALSCLIMIFSKLFLAIFPLFIYGLAFKAIGRVKNTPPPQKQATP
ncbi:MAG: hypothetical protein ACXVLQ_10375 [Bacteriovorax sp.]